MDKSKPEALEEYIKFRKLKNHTSAVLDIKFHINKFITFNKKPLNEFDEGILLDYVSKITPKYSTEMLNKVKSSYLKNFIKWYYIDWSARFRNLDAILKTEKAMPSYSSDDIVNEEQFKKLVQAEESHFWKAYFMTLFYGGCRPIEVCLLKWSDVEFTSDGAYITIVSKKNRTSFIKFVPSDVSYYLKELKNNKSEYVFYRERTGLPVDKKMPYRRMKLLSKQVLGREIDLLTLRHSIATIIYNKKDIKDSDIARQMGHSKSMKGKYVLNNKEQLKQIAKSIYINPEDLPPEKKHALELQIEKLSKENKYFSHWIKIFTDRDSGAITQQEATKRMKALALATDQEK